jgi:hypothetical protein
LSGSAKQFRPARSNASTISEQQSDIALDFVEDHFGPDATSTGNQQRRFSDSSNDPGSAISNGMTITILLFAHETFADN